ncbi:MAG: thiamine biosynthesis protein ApbE [Verrucomicrobiaceae bacterium]|nr:thiamine biosynthesis protein ApbE [Verrucomicrobiaceae bacterium]
MIFLLMPLSGCQRQHVVKFAGEAQGTTYHITVVDTHGSQSASDLQLRVEQRLQEIDLALSNYRDDSELSSFNRANVGEWIPLGHDLAEVIAVSNRISKESDGAFDITVAPLVELWGFGPHKKTKTIPATTEIEAAHALVDYRNLEIDRAQSRARKNRALTIDVNGIAQGYTVDQLAELLSALGYTDFLVEVGGELRLVGRNAEQELWHIGIEKPGDGLADAQQMLAGSNIGVTTAGDYHDYFEKDGVRYSHTIDPRTGRPIAHNLASVTVAAPTAVLADGYDTALEVMGPERGFAFAQRMHLAAYFILRDGAGFSARATPEMSGYLIDDSH